MFKHKLLTAALITPFILNGCAVVDYAENHHTVAYIATNQATMRVLDQADDSETWAQRTVTITEELENTIRDGKVTFDELFERVHDRIDWDSMSHSDEQLLGLVLSETERRLEQRINDEDSALSDDDLVKVKTFIGWVQQSAEDYIKYEVNNNG